VTGTDSITFRINNTEVYPIYDVEFMFTTDTGDTYAVKLEELESHQTVGYKINLDGTGSIVLDGSFVPTWQETSLKPARYSQSFSTNFNFGAGDSEITSGSNVLTDTIQFKIVDVDKIVSTKNYTSTITLNDIYGNAITPDDSPYLTITDPNGNVLIAGDMTLKYPGVYEFNNTMVISSIVGEYLTEVNVTYNGEDIYLHDVWRLISNPTQVEVDINSVCGTTVCADILITNEGITPYEYIYYWWVSTNFVVDYDDPLTDDRGQASKLVQPGDTWTIKRCLKFDHPGETGYYRAKTFYGEYSYATASFDRTSGCRGKQDLTDFFIIPPIDKDQAVFVGGGTLAAVALFMMIYKKKEEWYT
jgi:hypothetical protein